MDKNNRKFAKYIKLNTKIITTIGPIVKNKILTEDKEIVEELNQYFTSVFTQDL